MGPPHSLQLKASSSHSSFLLLSSSQSCLKSSPGFALRDASPLRDMPSLPLPLPCLFESHACRYKLPCCLPSPSRPPSFSFFLFLSEASPAFSLSQELYITGPCSPATPRPAHATSLSSTVTRAFQSLLSSLSLSTMPLPAFPCSPSSKVRVEVSRPARQKCGDVSLPLLHCLSRNAMPATGSHPLPCRELSFLSSEPSRLFQRPSSRRQPRLRHAAACQAASLRHALACQSQPQQSPLSVCRFVTAMSMLSFKLPLSWRLPLPAFHCASHFHVCLSQAFSPLQSHKGQTASSLATMPCFSSATSKCPFPPALA